MLPRCVITERPEARTQLWIRNGVENRRAHLQHVPYCHHFLVPAHGHMDRPMGHLAATFEMSLHLLTMRLVITHHIFNMALVTDTQLAETVAVQPPRIARVPRSTHSSISSGEVELTRQWDFPEMGKWRRQRRVCALAKACVHFSKTKAKRKFLQDTCAALPHARAVRIFTPSVLAHIQSAETLHKRCLE